MRQSDNIEKLFTQTNIETNSDVDKVVLGNAVNAMEQTINAQAETPSVRRIIMQSKITKFTAAAVIVLVGMVVVNQFDGSFDGAGVVWADVIDNFEQIQTFSCRLTIESEGMEIFGQPPKITSTMRNSTQLGRRMDTYIDDKEFSREFWIPEKNEVVIVIPQAKVYLRKILLSGTFDPTITQDPYTFFKGALALEYTELGRKKIGDVAVEGIEINDPQLLLNTFEKLTAHLWVDVESNLPVLFEISASSNTENMGQRVVFDNFEWNVPLEPEIFEPDIPDDYTLLAEIKIDNKSEPMAIEGLRSFARYTDGQYPSSMVFMIAYKEILNAWQASVNWQQRSPTEQERQQNQSIHSTCLFYVNLDNEGKEPAYYGNNVIAGDADAVLMRWRVSDDEYRVIFGDLTASNISADELAALENGPAFHDILQRPREDIKVKGIIGIDISNWPAIKVNPEMPAAKAGLQEGDVVIMVNGHDVTHITRIADAYNVLAAPVEEILSLRVERNGQVLDFDVERVPLPK